MSAQQAQSVVERAVLFMHELQEVARHLWRYVKASEFHSNKALIRLTSLACDTYIYANNKQITIRVGNYTATIPLTDFPNTEIKLRSPFAQVTIAGESTIEIRPTCLVDLTFETDPTTNKLTVTIDLGI